MGGKSMGNKPKIGILPIAKLNHQKDEIYQFAQYYSEKLSNEQTVEFEMEPVLFDEKEIVASAKKMETEKDVDAVLFIVGTWIFSSNVISAVNDLHVPFILYGLSDRIANGNLGASLQIKYVLQEMKKNFLFLVGKMRDEENYSLLLKYLRAAWVRKVLRNKRLATIGGKCMMMYQTQVNEFSWKSVFGIDFPQYDAVQVFKEMDNVNDEEAKRIEKEFLEKIDKVHWELPNGEKIFEDAIFKQAKLYLAFLRMKNLYDIDLFANKCMPEMSAIPYGFGYAACIATCMLNEAGIVTACEADVPAALSMYILNLLTGNKVFFADIGRVNKKDKRITFFNCGTAPISMADRKKGVELWPIPGNIADEALPKEYYIGKMKGASINFTLPEGRDVTLLRIGGNDDTLRFHVAKAKTCAREVEPDELFGQRWPGFGLQFEGDLERFLWNTTGHHYSIVFGDWVKELEFLASLYGIKFVFDA
ncbi:TPA: hypothetical protein ENX78_12955 [Candidatus Poribacteria bacterium]|nr:hypothetical protein [Candidatus Poribacteria bacterium]